MIFLLPAILTSTGILILFKLFERKSVSNIQAISANYLTASALGFLLFPLPASGDMFARDWFPFSLLAGLSLFLVFIVYAVSTQKAGLSVTSVSGKMSLIIPVLLGVFLLDNELPLIRILGVILALVSFYLTLKREREITPKRALYLYPALLLLGNGINDTLLNYAQVRHAGDETGAFLSVAFLAAFVPASVASAWRIAGKRETFRIFNILAGVTLGIFNFFSTYFFMAGLDRVDTAVFIPLFNAGIVLTGVFTGILFFREKMKPVNYAGVFLCLCAIALIALSQRAV